MRPEIENSLYLTEPFLKIKGYFPPIVSIFASKILFLKLFIYGLYLIFNYLKPSYKNAWSKSANIKSDLILLDIKP